MKKKIAVLVSSIIIGLSYGYCQTVPAGHWVYDYLYYFYNRGYLEEAFAEKPFSFNQLGDMINTLEKAELGPVEKMMVQEMKVYIGGKSGMTDSAKVVAGGFIKFSYSPADSFDFFVNPRIGAQLNKYITIYTSFMVQNSQPDYTGWVEKGLNAFNDQSVLMFENNFLLAKIGRDNLVLGPGRKGQLLFSAASPAFDHYMIRLKNQWLAFSFWGIKLDDLPVPAWLLGGTAPFNYYSHFINGHRIGLYFSKKLELGFNEVVIYGGAGEGWNLSYVNPLVSYHGHRKNTSSAGVPTNALISTDINWFALKNLQLWGELLVDDFQIDREDNWDLEPNEIGFTLGANWADPLHQSGTDVTTEFTQVRNRTYNVADNIWERYLHKNQPIGYYLGNDLQSFYLGIGRWWTPKVKAGLSYHLVRKGEGRIDGWFNTDFLDANRYSIATGYHENIPFGIVETRHSVRLAADFIFKYFTKAHAYIQHDLVYNAGNVEGVNKPEVQFGVQLLADYNRWWRL